jgi:hypothetical protein
VEAFQGIDPTYINQRLHALQEDVQRADERLAELRVAFGTPALASLADWGSMTLAEQRSILRAVIKRIIVVPGRGTLDQRVTIEPFEE